MEVINIVALLISTAALVVSLLARTTAEHTNRATIFDKRFDVYRDAEKYISAWIRHGHPDKDLLPLLVDAWNRSHFLFEASVTQYLRELWVDGVNASLARDTMEGTADRDRRQQAIETVRDAGLRAHVAEWWSWFNACLRRK